MITKRLKLIIATSALLVGGIAGLAAAGGHGMDPVKKAEVLNKYDANKDGKLDDTERAALRADRKAQRIAQFDTNKDGTLSESEKKAMFDAKAAEQFKALDTNGDGKLTLDEFKAGHLMMGHGHRHGAMRKKP